jgi:SAM-dependent methyltransferase
VEVLTVISLVVAVGALAVAGAAWRRASSYAGDPDALPEDVVGLRQEVAALRAEAAGSFRHLPAEGRRAVVVGCGLGGDSEHLARLGWRTTAFDISPAAVAAVRQRYPDSPVDYRQGNLLDLPDRLAGAFDLVVEIFTVQALHPTLRAQAGAGVRALLAPGGRALVVQFVRADDEDHTVEPPWLLSRAEMEAIASDDVVVDSLDTVHPPDGGHPLWRMLLRRAAPSGR